MNRIRIGGPQGVARPYTPTPSVNDDAEGQKAEALDHIARALSAIDHNIEVLAQHTKNQNEILGRILMAVSQARSR